VTLTATVTGLAAGGTPTGAIQFLTNNSPLSTPVALVAQNSTTATATYQWTPRCSVSSQQSISAVYPGDANYQGSIGPALTASGAATASNGSAITAPLLVQSCPDFSLTAGGSSTSTGTIIPGGSDTTVNVIPGGTIPPVTLTVTPVNGLSGAVGFYVSGVVSITGYTPTVTFSPASLTFASNSSAAQTTTITLTGITAALHMPGAPGAPEHRNWPWYAAGSGATLAGALLVFLPRRRRLSVLLLAAVTILAAQGATGCSSGSAPAASTGGGGVPTNPYAGTYGVTITAQYGQTTHTTLIIYNIN
jgi:hypothetical protein